MVVNWAELVNLVNEAASIAARKNEIVVTQKDYVKAFEALAIVTLSHFVSVCLCFC